MVVTDSRTTPPVLEDLGGGDRRELDRFMLASRWTCTLYPSCGKQDTKKRAVSLEEVLYASARNLIVFNDGSCLCTVHKKGYRVR